MHASQVQSDSISSNVRGSSCAGPPYLYLRQNLQAHSHSMLLLVHNERYEVLVVEPVQLQDHVTVAEMCVLIYPHDEEPGKCVDDQITQFKPGTMKLPLNLVIVFMVSFRLSSPHQTSYAA